MSISALPRLREIGGIEQNRFEAMLGKWLWTPRSQRVLSHFPEHCLVAVLLYAADLP